LRRLSLLTLSLILAATAATAQMKVKPAQPGETPAGQPQPLAVGGARLNTVTEFKRISQAEALKLHKEGKAVFIDVRSNEQFSLGHIKGALSIPGSQLLKRFNEVTPKMTVITYCACSEEQSSGRAAKELTARGVQNVFALKGGWDDWKSNGYPTAAGPK
jgi:rhodanese-related sulfurtransferase